MNNKIKILHLEDSLEDSELIHAVIENGGIDHEYFLTDNENDFLNVLETENISLILSDYSIPKYNGNEALKAVKEKYNNIPFIFVSGIMGEDAAISAMLHGATDYVLKNKLEKLIPAIKRANQEFKSKIESELAIKKLAASEARYRRLFESAKDGILILDAETGMIVDVNPFLIDLLGYSKEQFLEKEIWEIGFLKDIIANHDKFLELQQKNYIRYEDLPLKTTEGKEIHVEFVSNVYLVNNHKVIQCNIRDITERKHAEKAIQQSENKFRLLAESMPQIVWITRPDGWNIYFNQQWVDYTGLTLEESYGNGWNKPFHPDEQQSALEAWQNATHNNGIYSIESRIRRADGVYKWWLVRGVPVIDEHGTILNWYGTCTDINESKLSEIALKESEFSLKNAQAVAKIGSWETNLSDLSVIWSEEIYNIFGIDKDVFEASHPAFLSFVHPDDRTIVEDAFVTSLEKHSFNIIDHQIITPSGLVKFVEERWQIVFDDNGKPLKAVGTCQDISERKIAEIAISESEEKFRSYIENMPDGVFIADENGKYLEVNKAACQITGYSETELLNMTVLNITSPESLEKAGNEFLKVKSTGFGNCELYYRHKNGTDRIWSIDGVKLSDTRILGFVKDITERKLVEDALRESELRFRNLYQNAKIGLYRTTPDGKIIMANKDLIKMLGYASFEELSKRNVKKEGFKSSGQRQEFIEKIEKDDEVINLESTWLHIDGHDIFVREHAKAIRDHQGTTLFYDGMVEDITERKLSEKQIRDLAKFPEENIHPVYRISNDGVLLYANPASRKLLPAYFPETGSKITEQEIKNIKDIYNAGHRQTGEIVFNFRNISFDYVPVIESEYINIYGTDITERKQAEDLLQRNYSIQSTINSILKLSIEDIPLLELLKQAFDLIINVPSLNIESKGCIFLVDEKKDTLQMIVEKNISEPIKNACKSVPFGYCLCGKAASTQEIQFSDRLNKEHQTTYEGIQEHGHYCTPIVFRAKTLGVINVYLKPKHLIDQAEVDFLKAIANTLAGIIVRKNNEMELKTTLDNLELTVIQRTEEVNIKNSLLREEIEERINIENELSESEEKFRSLIEDAVDAIFLGDNQGNFMETNSVASLLSGYSKDELLKMNILDLVPEVSKSKFSRFDLLEKGETVYEEQILITKYKSEIPIEIKTKKMKDGNYQSIIRDITERKQAEKELRKLNMAVESSGEVVFMTNREGVITFINSEFTMVYGYSVDEVIGKVTPRILKSGVLEAKNYKAFWQALINKQTITGELINKTKDGKLIHIESSSNPIFDESGDIIGFLAIQRDITERKKTEDELIKSKESAEDANRMKSEFLANMSHEIRTPLNAIVGFSSILKEKTTGQKVFTEYLDNIIQSSTVLLNLINDILDLSKIESGRMIINNQSMNINNIIHELQSVFIMKAQEKGLSINIQISNNIPGSIIADEKYLRQILFNLIGNAVKFTYKGSVDIIVNIIPKDKKGSKVDIIFKVIDTGIGIPADQLKIIFEPFIQVSQNSRGKYGGTGLGLSITKRLVELMGGTISVESIIGQGSVFSVSLFNLEISSLVIDENRNQNNKELLNIKFNNPMILIAEDILSNRQVIKGYLEAFNIRIIETENGEDCISAIRKQRPDLILMDIQMPVMDGYTTINIIRSDNDWKDIPIIVLTATGMKQQKDQIQKVADDFLLKPIYKNELIEKLIKYLPYEVLPSDDVQPEEISTTQMYIDAENKLPDEIKKEIDQTFLKDVVELEEVLNIEELLAFIKELEKINEKYQVSKIKEYCDLLTQYAESFNIKQINTCLRQLFKFINK